VSPRVSARIGCMLNNSATIEAPMDESIRRTLSQSGVIDITTTGRRSGEPRRIEIVYHVIDGRIFISGQPNPNRRRSWLANLEADPKLTFHLKRGVKADLPASARIVTDEAERRAVLAHVARAWNRTDLEAMVAFSPLIEVTVEGLNQAA
jgi:deazaflavin-dependent oxidoreductase (nitroreductase family)